MLRNFILHPSRLIEPYSQLHTDAVAGPQDAEDAEEPQGTSSKQEAGWLTALKKQALHGPLILSALYPDVRPTVRVSCQRSTLTDQLNWECEIKVQADGFKDVRALVVGLSENPLADRMSRDFWKQATSCGILASAQTSIGASPDSPLPLLLRKQSLHLDEAILAPELATVLSTRTHVRSSLGVPHLPITSGLGQHPQPIFDLSLHAGHIAATRQCLGDSIKIVDVKRLLESFATKLTKHIRDQGLGREPTLRLVRSWTTVLRDLASHHPGTRVELRQTTKHLTIADFHDIPTHTSLYSAQIIIDSRPISKPYMWFDPKMAQRLAIEAADLLLERESEAVCESGSEFEMKSPLELKLESHSEPELEPKAEVHETVDNSRPQGGQQLNDNSAAAIRGQDVRSTPGLNSRDLKHPRSPSDIGREAITTTLPASNIYMAVDAMKEAHNQGLDVGNTMLAPSDRHWGSRWAARPPVFLNETLQADYYKRSLLPGMATLLRQRLQLPVMDPDVMPELLNAISSSDVSIILGTTGSGKSTQVPQMILDDGLRKGYGAHIRIICTQPRRLSTTSLAQRVAYERDESLGVSVGYQLRQESKLPRPHGSITFCTTGVLLRRFLDDPVYFMSSFSHIIIDEIHERSREIDMALVLLREAISTRKAAGKYVPKILLMSATIDPTRFVNYFSQPAEQGSSLTVSKFELSAGEFRVQSHYLPEIVSSLSASGVEHPTIGSLLKSAEGYGSADYIRKEFDFAHQYDLAPVQHQKAVSTTVDPHLGENVLGLVAATVAHLAVSKPSGDILVFLPGLSHIHTVATILAETKPLDVDFEDRNRFRIFNLHSTLRDANGQVFKPVPPGCRRIILATNIAETSITLPDVVFVVDTGLSREHYFDHAGQTRYLPCTWIGKFNAEQRKGRAGRVRNGHYYALFTQERCQSFQDTANPQILSSNLIQQCLQLSAQPNPHDFKDTFDQMLDPPDPKVVDYAIEQLQKLDALTHAREITSLGRIMNALNMDPAVAKALLLGTLFGCLEPLLILAAHYSSPDPLMNGSASSLKGNAIIRRSLAPDSESDAISIIEAFRIYHKHYVAEDSAMMMTIQQNYHIRHSVFRSMLRTSNYIYHMLRKAGFVPPLTDGGADVFRSIPHSVNFNNRNMTLVKAICVNTIHPNLAVWKDKQWHLETSNYRGKIHPSSANGKPDYVSLAVQKEFRSTGRLLAYEHKNRILASQCVTKFAFLYGVSMLTPLQAILFSRTAALSPSGHIHLDGWLPINAQVDEPIVDRLKGQENKILMELKKTFNRYLGYLFSRLDEKAEVRTMLDEQGLPISRPVIPILGDKLRQVMIDSVLKLLAADDLYWKSFRERRRAKNSEMQLKMQERLLANRGRPEPIQETVAEMIEAVRESKYGKIEDLKSYVVKTTELSNAEDEDEAAYEETGKL